LAWQGDRQYSVAALRNFIMSGVHDSRGAAID
jgi:hypothetical protein